MGTLSHLYTPQGDYEAAQNRSINDLATLYTADSSNNMYRRQLAEFAKPVKSGKADYALTDRALRVQKPVDSIYKGH